MKNSLMKQRVASVAAAAVMSLTTAAGTLGGNYAAVSGTDIFTAFAADSSVKIIQSGGFGEGVYVTWSAVSGASRYNVYVDNTKIVSMLMRQNSG